MIRNFVLLLTIAIVLTASACNSTTTTTNNNANNNTTTKTTQTPALPTVDLSTPKATLTAFVEAVKKKDIAAIKTTLSKNALSVAQDTGGGDADKAINEALTENKGSIPASVEIKDEKINGDKATLQAKDADGKWIEAKFVKEGNSWKYDMFADMGSMGNDKTEHGKGH